MQSTRASARRALGEAASVGLAGIVAGALFLGCGAESGAGSGGGDAAESDVGQDAEAPCVPAADTPTWNERVGAIVAERCGLCHGATPQFGAPLPLASYADTQITWPAGSSVSVVERIANQLEMGAMPPPSQPPLTAEEREALLRWTAECAPEGSGEWSWQPAQRRAGGLLPAPPPPIDAWPMPLRAGGFSVPMADDTYRCFPFELDLESTGIEGAQHIVRFDFELDATEVVHHIVLFADPTGSFGDAPGPCAGMPANSLFLYAWAPGGQPLQFPDGLGLPVEHGDRVLLQVHYNNSARHEGVVDDSGVVVHLAPARPEEVGMVVTGPAGFQVPALGEAEVSSQCRVPHDVTFIATMPHMHEIGKTIDVEAERADGTWESLVSVPNWSFDDQPFYFTPYTVAAGERLVTRCTFQNPHPFAVFSGEATNDEMCYAFAYHYPPLGRAFCDEPLDEAAAWSYEPGPCAGPSPPDLAQAPLAEGGIKLVADLVFQDTPLPAEASWRLGTLNMLLPQPVTLVGTVDLDATRFEAQGFARVQGGALVVDLHARGTLVTTSGASVPFDIQLSEAGPTLLDEEGRVVFDADADGACSASGMPLVYLRPGQQEGDERVVLAGVYYALLDVTLVFETRWRPLGRAGAPHHRRAGAVAAGLVPYPSHGLVSGALDTKWSRR